ncbi:MAG TPA: response regulator [Opitutus sp.]|nr:response regulator [Opitutus sp.]
MRPVLHVLYAEDNPVDADLIRSHFARTAPDFGLEIVHRAEEFLPLARTRRHAALLLDQHLPDMDGLEVLKILAQEGIDTPVILFTAASDGELASQALRLGADDYVPKRAGYLETLPQNLRDVIERRRRQPAAGRAPRARPRRILLIEDRATEAALLVEQLATAAPHLTIETLPTPARALARLEIDPEFDLIIGDHRPPAINALELVAAIRAQPRRTPFLLVARAAADDTIVAAFKLGASDCVLKHDGYSAELALRIDLAIDRHELMLANERAAAELTERQRALAALRESEKRLNLALDAGHIGLWSWQLGTTAVNFSSRWKAQIGYADPGIRNDFSEWKNHCHPEDFARFHDLLARYIAAPWRDFSTEYRLRHQDGSWRWFLLHADLELDADGRPVRMIGSQIDVTTLKQQQAELTSASARLQRLSRRLLAVQEAERRHLARELHDEIGQILTVAKIHLQSAALAARATPAAAGIQEPISLLDRLLSQVRSLSLNLRPPLLDDLGVVHALHWLLQQPQTRTSAPHVHLIADPNLRRYDAALETACFRIAQEAITNALRHSRATTINLTLTERDDVLRLVVQDDGVGFDAAAARARAESGSSLGLLGMHERALLAGGTLSLLSSPGNGTEVEAVFPLSKLSDSP